MKEVRTGIPETENLKKRGNTVEAATPIRETKEKQHKRPSQPPLSNENRAERDGHTNFKDFEGFEAYSGIFDDLKRDGQTPNQQGDKKDQATQEQKSDEPRLSDKERFNKAREKFGFSMEWEEWNSPEARERRKKIGEELDRHWEEWKNLTPEQREEGWRKFLALGREIHKHQQREQREKAAWMHERDPRYDPMTGDLLLPDELPLSQTSTYHFAGKTRPRCFIHADNPLLPETNPIQADREGEAPESEYHQRLMQRLRKAGFVEIEPTLADKAHFEPTQWLRSLSPTEQMLYFDESMRQMREQSDEYMKALGTKDESAGEKAAKFIAALLELLLELIAPEYAEEMKVKKPAHQPA